MQTLIVQLTYSTIEMTNQKESTEDSSLSRLDFFQGEVGVKPEDKAKSKLKIKGYKIFPEVEYWEPVFGLREIHELKDSYYQNNPTELEFHSNYWVEEGLHSSVRRLCKEQSIDLSYVDDLCVPLSDYRRTNFNVLGNDIHLVAENVIELNKMFEHLKNPNVGIVNITVTLGTHGHLKVKRLSQIKDPEERKRDIGFTPKYLEQTYYDCRPFNITTPRALLPLTKALRKLPESDDSLNNHLNNPDWEALMNRSPSKLFRLGKDKMTHIVYRFLINKEIAKSPNEARGITGMLVSLVDSKYAMSEEEFLKRQTEDLARYDSRKAYFSDTLKNKMNELDK